MPRISNFLKKFDYRFSHVSIFGNMFPESHDFVAACAGNEVKQFRLPSLITLGKIIGTCIIDTAWNRHSNETVTLIKHVNKDKNMLKYMIEFLRKFENHDIKICRVNKIRISKSINLLKFCTVLGSCDRGRSIFRA